MTDYRYDDYEEERLVREAVLELIERHRDEYLDIVNGTHESRIRELQDQARKDKLEINRLKQKVEDTLVERDRWRGRILSGQVVPDDR